MPFSMALMLFLETSALSESSCCVKPEDFRPLNYLKAFRGSTHFVILLNHLEQTKPRAPQK